MRKKPSCDVCERINSKAGRETPCKDCLPPLYEENRDAVKIYMLVQDQVRISPMGGIVGLDHNAVHAALELYEIADRRRVFEQVLQLAAEFREE